MSVSNFAAEEEFIYGTEPKNFIYVLAQAEGDTLADVLRKYAYNVIVGCPGDPRKVADPQCVGVVVPYSARQSKNAKSVIEVANALDIPVHSAVLFSEDSKTISLVRMVDGDFA